MKLNSYLTLIWLALAGWIPAQTLSPQMLPQPTRLFRQGATPTSDDKLWLRDLLGLSPLATLALSGGTTNFLRADGTFAAPPGTGGGGTVTSVGVTSPGGIYVGGSPVTGAGSISLTLDPDIAAISPLTTTAYGLNFLEQVDAAASRTKLGLGTAATQATSAFDAVGAAATAQAAAISTASGDATTKANSAQAAAISAASTDATTKANAAQAYAIQRANHTGSQPLSTISDAGALAALGAVTTTQITDGTITNADLSASAAIALSKLATDPLARANHTGSQLMSTISNAGSIATQSAAAVAITGGAVAGVTISNVTYPSTTQSGTVLDFSAGNKTVTLTANTTFTSSNLVADKGIKIRVIGGASPYTVTFPSTWHFQGSAGPTFTVAAGKWGNLAADSWGTTDAACIAAFSVEP